MVEKIKASFIFEILGRPPEHIKSTLEGFIDKLGEQQGIEIINKKIHKPKLIEKNEDKKDKETDNEKEKINRDLFTTFAEIELSADNLNLIFMIVINMLPANISIIEPSNLKFSNFELSNLLSELTVKLHKYDEISKAMAIENSNLQKIIKELKAKGQ